MRPYSLFLFLVFVISLGFFAGPAMTYALDFPDESLPTMGAESDASPGAEAVRSTPAAPQRPLKEIGPGGLIELARNLAGQGEVAEAINTYKLLLDRFPRSKKGNLAYYELGLLLYRNGGALEARSYLERVVSSWWVEPALREKTRILLREIDSLLKRGTADSGLPAVGLVLPLKGRYAPYGEAALKGALLSAGVFGPAIERPVEVVVRDVGESPALGAKAVSALAKDDKVAGIVGPLRSATAYQSAARAEAEGITLISLSRKVEISGAGGYVFRNSLSPAEQADAVARYAVNVLGKIKFAVLYPENVSGRIMAEAFMNTVTELGAEVTAEDSYRQGTKDFGKILRDLFKIETDEVREGRRTITEYFPSADVEALYIPDSYRTVGLITPYIKYYNIEDIQLLGSSGWNSKRLVELAGRAVSGAVFVDGFFPRSRRESSSIFARRFRDTYGRDPGELEAEAYDATSILIKAIDSDIPDREAVRERLLEMRGYEGAGGPIHFDSYGGSVKKPFILTVKGRAIVEAEPTQIIEPTQITEPPQIMEPPQITEPPLPETEGTL